MGTENTVARSGSGNGAVVLAAVNPERVLAILAGAPEDGEERPAAAPSGSARGASRGLTAAPRDGGGAVRFADKAPKEAYATLLDEGTYLCSARTMYRLLAAQGQVRERRDQLRHPAYVKPELCATAPNQVWSWDITKLLGPRKWTYY